MSVYYNILDATKSLVSTITGLTTTGQVVIRKKPAYISTVDAALPLVCICPTVERLDDYVFPNEVFLIYPVQVALIQESKLLLANTAAMQAFLDYREAIRKKLSTVTLSGVTGMMDFVGYNPNPAFDSSALDSGFDVSVQEFTYKVTETRNS